MQPNGVASGRVF